MPSRRCSCRRAIRSHRSCASFSIAATRSPSRPIRRPAGAVEQAIADGERLRAQFGAKHGKPRETYVAGMSMGGTLTVMSLESAPDTYAGGLSLCGAIERSDSLLQRDFALLAAFDHYFPGLLGPLVPVPANYLPTAAIESRLRRHWPQSPMQPNRCCASGASATWQRSAA
jgi:pimeloyl-ACP methyl ester carboxylesterase